MDFATEKYTLHESTCGRGNKFVDFCLTSLVVIAYSLMVSVFSLVCPFR